MPNTIILADAKLKVRVSLISSFNGFNGLGWRSLRLTLLLTAAGLLSTAALAQVRLPPASPLATVAQGVGLATVTVEYSRPALLDRTMFGDRVPYGKVWRTGANATTRFTVSDEIQVNDKPLPAGSYGLFTIPGPTEWVIIINKDAKGSGAFNYKPQNDVMRLVVKPQSAALTEHFTIEFTDFTATTAKLALRWERVQVNLFLEHDADARIMAQLHEALAKPNVLPDTYLEAADYYYQTNRDLKQARTWADTVVAVNQQYWTYYVRAKIAIRQGDCPTARADAQAGLKLAEQAGDDAFIKNYQRVLLDCPP